MEVTRATSADDTRRRNVILILSDQMQYRRQGRLDPESSTPHLDGLAEAGVDFSHCFVSNPQCTPSRTSLLTGLHPHEAGVMTNYGFFDHSGHVDETHDTVGQAFARAGYRTAYFGKSHLGFPLQRLGYEVVEDHGGVVGGLAEVDRSIAADACDFIRTTPRDRPFFLTVSFHEPHPPFSGPRLRARAGDLRAAGIHAGPARRPPGVPPATAAVRRGSDDRGAVRRRGASLPLDDRPPGLAGR